MINSTRQEYLSLKESAEYLGISESTACRSWGSWARHGVIPSRFPNRTLRFKKSELDQMLQSLKVEGV